MEYAKDEVFSIRYNAEKDKLEFKHRHKLITFLRKYRVMTLLLSLGITFSIVNFVLIYNFFNLIKTI